MADDRPDLTNVLPTDALPHEAPSRGDLRRLDPTVLYERDFYVWTQRQAATLRVHARRADGLDYRHLAQEVRDLGSEILHSCESWLIRIIEHLLKLEHLDSPDDVRHWRNEVNTFRTDMLLRMTPTIRLKLRARLSRRFHGARRSVAKLYEAPQVLQATPYTWEQIADPDWWPEPRGKES